MSMREYFEIVTGPLLTGLGVTLQVFSGALVVATVVGLLVGSARLSRSRTLRYAAIGFTEFFRGTSALVQMFWVFYALPLMLGFPLPPLWAAWVVIGLNAGAYMAEMVRGAISSVPHGQFEAAVALNIPPRTRFRRIVLPQAVPVMVPNYINEAITILKETAIVSLIGIFDMTHIAKTLRTENGNSTLIFLTIAVIYLCMALIIAGAGKVLEARVDIRRIPKHMDSSRPAAPMKAEVNA
ncbi:ectoine/hydroxyectoine ABC transporter permease subunit EhuC (plasmid) [Arthrobacter sp. UC242_113]|uniref:ectoine/hydroxyectoine ABC transporter permease subunit EhuC n=1 Tax=Arthrobacter sp. UC242_113 TaxID=3374550 RepID=UPI00375685D3